MKRAEVVEKLEQDILMRKEWVVKGIRNELEYLEKYLDQLEKAETVNDVLNGVRNVNDYAGNVGRSAADSFKTMNELRLGLYYLGCVED